MLDTELIPQENEQNDIPKENLPLLLTKIKQLDTLDAATKLRISSNHIKHLYSIAKGQIKFGEKETSVKDMNLINYLWDIISYLSKNIDAIVMQQGLVLTASQDTQQYYLLNKTEKLMRNIRARIYEIIIFLTESERIASMSEDRIIKYPEDDLSKI